MSLFEQIKKQTDDDGDDLIDLKQKDDEFVDELANELKKLSCSSTEERIYPSFIANNLDETETVDENGRYLFANADKSRIILDPRMVPIPPQGRIWLKAKREDLQRDVIESLINDPMIPGTLVIFTPALLMMMSGDPPLHVLISLLHEKKKTLDEMNSIEKRGNEKEKPILNFGYQKLGRLEADILSTCFQIRNVKNAKKVWPARITAAKAAAEYRSIIQMLIENNGFYPKHTLEGMSVRTVIEDADVRLTEELDDLLKDKNLRTTIRPYMSQIINTLNLRSIDDPDLYGGTAKFGPKLLAEVQHCMADYTINLLRALERWILRVAAPHWLVQKIGREDYETHVMPYFFTDYTMYPHQPRPEDRNNEAQREMIREIESNLVENTKIRMELIPEFWCASPRFLSPAIDLDNYEFNTPTAPASSNTVEDDPEPKKIRKVRRTNAPQSLKSLHLPMPLMNFETTARHLYAIVNHIVSETAAGSLNAGKSRSFWGNTVLPFKSARIPYKSISGEILPEMLTGPLISWVNLVDSSKPVEKYRLPRFKQMPRLYFTTKVATSGAFSSNEKLAHFVAYVRHKSGIDDFCPSRALVDFCESGDKTEVSRVLAALSFALGF